MQITHYRLMNDDLTNVHIVTGKLKSALKIEFLNETLCELNTNELNYIHEYSVLKLRLIKRTLPRLHKVICPNCKSIFKELYLQ